MSQETCLLCGRGCTATSIPNICRRCTQTTALPRIVTVTQLAALTPGLTEHKIRHYLKYRKHNGLEEAGALYLPPATNSVFIHLDRFEGWFSG